jgi:hypothetical protein
MKCDRLFHLVTDEDECRRSAPILGRKLKFNGVGFYRTEIPGCIFSLQPHDLPYHHPAGAAVYFSKNSDAQLSVAKQRWAKQAAVCRKGEYLPLHTVFYYSILQGCTLHTGFS